MANEKINITKDSLINAIERFNSINWESVSKDEIFHELPLELKNAILLDPIQLQKGQSVFRARSFDSISTEDNICKKNHFNMRLINLQNYTGVILKKNQYSMVQIVQIQHV
jgi:hypothetical protein